MLELKHSIEIDTNDMKGLILPQTVFIHHESKTYRCRKRQGHSYQSEEKFLPTWCHDSAWTIAISN
jgi:hypothetical protein